MSAPQKWNWYTFHMLVWFGGEIGLELLSILQPRVNCMASYVITWEKTPSLPDCPLRGTSIRVDLRVPRYVETYDVWDSIISAQC